jgi:3-hydroxy-3-methylglutaryl CoA synthase
MSGTGIIAFGGYVPQLRLRRSAAAAANIWANPSLRGQGKGERAFAAWDEDVVTMAVEAGRDALPLSGRADTSAVILASTTPPFADRLNAGIVAGALGLSPDIVAFDMGGSMRAGSSALIAGQALAAAKDGPVIVAASEMRRSKPGSAQEFANGDAAAAFVLGTEGVIAEILASHSVVRDFVDHFRPSGEAHDYGWEERWIRDEGYQKIATDAAKTVLDKAGISAEDVDIFLLPTAMGRVDAGVAKALGIKGEAIGDSLKENLGYAGAAHGLVMLAKALDTADPGQTVLLLDFANGCDATLLKTTEAIADFKSQRGISAWLDAGVQTDDYMRFLSYKGEVSLEWGARAEFGNKYALTAEYRYSHDMLAFVGGRDRETGVVQFPKSPMAVAPGASGVAEYDDVPLADLSARIVSCTADWLTYHPSPPFYFGLVQFDNGARVAMEFVDVGEGAIDVGAEVEMRFRIKEIDGMRGYRHYFWKATPVLDQQASMAEAAE